MVYGTLSEPQKGKVTSTSSLAVSGAIAVPEAEAVAPSPIVLSLDLSASLSEEGATPVVGHKVWWSKRKICGLCCVGFFALLLAVLLPGWFCCSLWLAAPDVSVVPLSFRPVGLTTNVKDPSVTFTSSLELELYNPNIIGATATSAVVEVWYSGQFLGAANTKDSVWLGAKQSATAPIEVDLVQSPISSVLAARLFVDCSTSGGVELWLNFTTLDVHFSFIHFSLADLTAHVVIKDCV